MKKLFFVAMAAVAMTFGSCTDNKPAPVVEPEADTTEIEVISTDSIASVLEAADSTQLGSLLQTVQEQVENLKNVDPAKAKEYLATVQAFLKENADKIKAVVGTGTIASLVDQVTSLPEIEVPDVAAAAQEAVEGAAADVKEKAEEAADGAKEAVNDKVEEVKDAAANKVDEVKNEAADKAAAAVDNAADKIKGALGK